MSRACSTTSPRAAAATTRTLGARDARRFCAQHGMAKDDCDLVAWLVEHHLIDVADRAEAGHHRSAHRQPTSRSKVGDERRLAALYLLTVADIRGTSPRVWNAWKAKLLEDLFRATRRVLAGESAAQTIQDSVQARQVEAQRLLRLYAVPDNAEQALWKHLDTPYFQRHTADEIAWHARHLYWRVERTAPVVKARLARDGAGLQVLVYLPDQKELFARVCGFFGRVGPVDSRGQGAHDAQRLRARHVRRARSREPARVVSRHDPAGRIRTDARCSQNKPPLEAPPEGRISRQLRHFPLTPQVQIFPDERGTHYILEVVAGDRPGLLARIAYVLARNNVNVASAKINTLGERAEDVFLIDGARLHDEQALLLLETALFEQLRT